MSRFHKQKCYTRWSSPSLHKSYSFHWAQTSEEEIPFPHQSQLSPPLFSIAQQYTPLKETPEYCLCGRQCEKRRSSNSFYVPCDIKILKCLSCQKPHKIRENLEIHLTGIQVEEALAEDRQTTLIQYLDLNTAALEALAQYGQSLQVSELAVYRVLNISHLLTLPQLCSTNSKPDSAHLTTHLEQLETQKENKLIILKDLIEYCSKHVILPKHLCELMNDHYTKKKQFCTAAKNLKKFLNNSKLSATQMEKLNCQYITILNKYQQSRHALDLELPKVINMQLKVLQEGFEKITKFYNDTYNGNEIITLFKSIGEKLCTDSTTRDKVSNDLSSPRFELCQKCKVNRIDEK